LALKRPKERERRKDMVMSSDRLLAFLRLLRLRTEKAAKVATSVRIAYRPDAYIFVAVSAGVPWIPHGRMN